MKRHIFLSIAALVQLIFGLMFFFFTETATKQFMIDTCSSSLLLAKSVGVFLVAFGLLNFLSRKSPDNIALKAIMIATLFYLIISVSCDAYWTIKGSLTAQAWGSIIIRTFFIVGYIFYISKIKIDPTTKGQ